MTEQDGKVWLGFSKDFVEALRRLADTYDVPVEMILQNCATYVAAECAAITEVAGPGCEISFLPLSVFNEDGQLLTGDALFAAIKSIKLGELKRIAGLEKLAADKVFENLPARGSA